MSISNEPGDDAQSVAPRKSWPRRHKILTGLGILFLIGIIGNLANGADHPKAKPPPAAISTPRATPTATPTTPDATTPAAAPTTAAATPTHTAAPTKTAPVAVTYRGSGDKVLAIRKPSTDAAIITTTIRGPSDNNTIYALDSSLQEGDLLVNTIGSYSGSSILDKSGEQTKRLKLSISGTWTVTIKPLSAAHRMNTAFSGRGDDVLLYTGPTGVLTVKNVGPQDNFTVYYYGANGDANLLVNGIGSYSGETPTQEGPGVLEVDGGGRWTFAVTP